MLWPIVLGVIVLILYGTLCIEVARRDRLDERLMDGKIVYSESRVPVRWDDDEMGYVATLQVGSRKSPVCVVLDTGSAYLAIATRACADDGACLSHHAGYDERESETAVDTGRSVTIGYGSLTIHSRVVRDEVVVGDESLGLVDIHAAQKMTGTHSNVMGLMAPPDGKFLSSLCRRRTTWSLSLGEGEGSLEWNGPPINVPWIPNSTEFAYLGAYIVDIVDVLIGPTWKPFDGPVPRFMLVDTGTPFSSVSSNCKDILDAPSLCFVLPNRQRLYVHSDQMQAGVRPPNPTLDAIAKDTSLFLLGAILMRNKTWHFDVENQRIAFVPHG